MTKELYKKLLVWIEQDKLVKFYQNKLWRKARMIKLNSSGHRCSKCGKKATMVHHKKKVKEHPRLALLLDNLEAQCNKCHNLEHPEKLQGVHERKFKNEERW
ncbi:HNH endonuclease [Enterococcus sulfureus]